MRHNKYGARQTVQDGQVYDSILERDCAHVLDLLASQGRILDYNRQVPYELAPARPGRRAVQYVCDFAVFFYAYGQARRHTILLEAKGYNTRAGALKMRWFQEKYPHIPLHVVKAPQDVIAVLEDLEREHTPGGKESSHAHHTDTDTGTGTGTGTH